MPFLISCFCFFDKEAHLSIKHPLMYADPSLNNNNRSNCATVTNM